MFKDRLKEARKNAGLSQEKLGHILGISKQTVSDYERGYSEPDMNKIMQFMKVLNVDANFLWMDEMAEPSPESNVSNDAMRIATLFDSLDDAGKELINVVVDLQVKRMNGEQMKAKRIPLIKATDDSVIFAKYHAKREVEEIVEECESIAHTCE
jgi:transcriptional regulator with XRE-family HTH domain